MSSRRDVTRLAAQDEDPESWTYVNVAIGLATSAALLFEIALTRIFSVILWYHFGFMVISLAMLGIGLAGIVVYLYPERFPRRTASQRAASAATAFSISTVAALLAFHFLVSVRTTWPLRTFELGLVFLIMVVPFVFAGLTIAVPFSRYTERIGWLYAIDLAGAAFGAVLVVPLVALLGGHKTVIVAAMLAALAAVLFARARGGRGAGVGGWAAFGACLVVFALAGSSDLFRVRFSKHGAEEGVVFEEWNSFSRVTVLESKRTRWGWNLSREAPPGGVRHNRIRIDGGAGTPMLAFHGDFEPLDFLRYDVSSLGYQVRPQRSVVIIGAGGGRDILTARSLGVEHIHAVEINPIIVELIRSGFSGFTQSPYDLPGVTYTVADGRSYLATNDQRFDHVQISAVDTIAASAAGALALVEQSLYTTEAFLEYFDHLEDDGILSITRPFNLERLEVTLRTVDLFRTAWTARGVEKPERHLIVIGSRAAGDRWGVLLASRSSFRRDELRAVRELCEKLGFDVLYAHRAGGNVEEIEAMLGDERESFLRRYPKDVEATTDDRPYFFYFRKPGEVVREALTPGATGPGTRVGVAPDLVTRLFLLVTALTLVTAFGVPLALGRLRLRDARGSGTSLLYFAGIGLGFILVEIALLQRYTLLLGQPIYAFAVILGTVLVFSGLGSSLSQRARAGGLRLLSRLAVLAILAGGTWHALWMPGILHAAMHWDFSGRLALTVGTLAPLALVMGIALPTGMRLMELSSPPALAWAWGVNGTLSVLGTVLAMCISVFYGITMTLAVGLGAYALALVTPWRNTGAVGGPLARSR